MTCRNQTDTIQRLTGLADSQVDTPGGLVGVSVSGGEQQMFASLRLRGRRVPVAVIDIAVLHSATEGTRPQVGAEGS